jgi:hypothetical protein
VNAFTRVIDDEIASYLKQNDSTIQYTFDSYENINDNNRVLFEKLNTRLLNLGAAVKREFTKSKDGERK